MAKNAPRSANGTGRRLPNRSKPEDLIPEEEPLEVALARHAAEGVSPLDVMVATMRLYYERASKGETLTSGARVYPPNLLLLMAVDLATKAAPYVNARIGPVAPPIPEEDKPTSVSVVVQVTNARKREEEPEDV